MSAYYWVAISTCVFTALFVTGLAIFWGREVGAVGYWFWGIVAAFTWAMTVTVWVVIP